MKKSFLGRGVQFPIGVNPTGGLALSAFESNIEESIHLILGTAPGERVMRPEFGCQIHDCVFQPNNATTASLVSYHVRDALVKWEPRIKDVRVTTVADGFEENVMRVEVTYAVARTNDIRNMVYPFYLRREQDA
jgi:phage baseplate assembly protein W